MILYSQSGTAIRPVLAHVTCGRGWNRWTSVCNCRTTKCSYMVSGADKMDNECRYRGGLPNKVAGGCVCIEGAAIGGCTYLWCFTGFSSVSSYKIEFFYLAWFSVTWFGVLTRPTLNQTSILHMGVQNPVLDMFMNDAPDCVLHHSCIYDPGDHCGDCMDV